MHKKTAEDFRANADRMQALYEQAEADNRSLETILEALPLQSERMHTLMNYYTTEWADDREQVHPESTDWLPLFSEDLVYDAIQERIALLEKLLEVVKQSQEDMFPDHV